MKTVDPKSMGQLLKDHQLIALQKIFRQAQRLQAIDKLLISCLPQEIVPHCCTLNFTATCLTLGVDSAVWSTRLQYLKSDLLTQLQQYPQLATVKQLQIRVYQPVLVASETQSPPKGHQLSQKTKQLIKETAMEMEDSLLKKSLLRLAEAVES